MGASRSLSINVRTYYKKYVGPLNQVVPIRGHNFVALDAPGLVDEDYRRSASGLPHQQWSPTLGGTLDFIKELDTQGESCAAGFISPRGSLIQLQSVLPLCSCRTYPFTDPIRPHAVGSERRGPSGEVSVMGTRTPSGRRRHTISSIRFILSLSSGSSSSSLSYDD